MIHMIRTAIVICCLLSGEISNAQRIYLNSVSKQHNLPVGDLKGVKEMIWNEMEYPIEDIKSETDGTVTIRYRLLKSGFPKSAEIIKHASTTLDAEALRLFKKIQFPGNKYRPEFQDRYDEMTFAFKRKDWVKVYKKRGYKEVPYVHEPIDTTEKVYLYRELKEDKPFAMFEDDEPYQNYVQFIAAKMQFPEDALRLGLKGEVVISFVIEQSGMISNIHVQKAMPAGCTEEALRLIKMIKWFPGLVNDVAVRTQMYSSIGFGVNSIPFYGSFNAGGSGGQ